MEHFIFWVGICVLIIGIYDMVIWMRVKSLRGQGCTVMHVEDCGYDSERLVYKVEVQLHESRKRITLYVYERPWVNDTYYIAYDGNSFYLED